MNSQTAQYFIICPPPAVRATHVIDHQMPRLAWETALSIYAVKTPSGLFHASRCPTRSRGARSPRTQPTKQRNQSRGSAVLGEEREGKKGEEGKVPADWGRASCMMQHHVLPGRSGEGRRELAPAAVRLPDRGTDPGSGAFVVELFEALLVSQLPLSIP